MLKIVIISKAGKRKYKYARGIKAYIIARFYSLLGNDAIIVTDHIIKEYTGVSICK